MEQLLETAGQDLRLALFALGAIFLLVLVVWEVTQRRRQKQRERSDLPDPLLDAARAPKRAEVAPAAPVGERLELPNISVRDRLVEPTIVDIESIDLDESGKSLPLLESGVHDSVVAATRDEPQSDEFMPDEFMSDEPMFAAPASTPAADEPVSVAPATTPVPGQQAADEKPRLEWPAEDRRRIVALRIVARADERFTGVSLRQALQGEGFLHGELDIFHRPVADGRVLLSAASLTRPGGFDLANMDSTLFLGLNLFAVLPGPLPGRDTVDKLLLVGHTLAQRLRGDLRDSRGEVLTEARLAELRREAAAADLGDSVGTV